MLKQLNQTGDTIVEVLIAISVISLVLVGAYIATNKSTASTQDAQERTQAVKLVETQIESLRASTGGLTTPGDCFAAGVEVSGASLPQGSNPCIVIADGSKAAAVVQPAYTLSITPLITNPNVFAVKAEWVAVSGSSTNNVTMYYEP